jgi:GTPase SAR1 family protein
MYYTDSEAALLTYDITDRQSFEDMKKWYDELCERGPK